MKNILSKFSGRESVKSAIKANWEAYHYGLGRSPNVELAIGRYLFPANPANDLKWRCDWVDTKNSSGSFLGVAATFRLSSESLGRQIPRVYEPNQVAMWKAVSGPLPLTFQRSFERVEGGTRFTLRYDTKLRGFFNLIMLLLARSVRRQHEGDLRKVKGLMEARAL